MSNYQEPQDISELFGVSVKDGLKMLGNNTKIYLRLLNSFAGSTMYDDVVSTVAEGDAEKATAAAHTLKGATGNMHLDDLYEKSKEIEGNIKATGQMPSDAEMAELAEIQGKTLASVNALIAHPEWVDALKG